MRKLTIFIFTIILMMACAKEKNQQRHSLRIMSYNIKYDNKGDSVESWAARRKQVTNLISFYKPDFLGTQEALYNQVQDIDALPNLSYIGVGRQDGKKAGEFSALFYNNKRFELVSGTDSTLWLSKTPSKPSKSWNAALPRILSWGQFRERSTGKKLWVFNTHFDHISAKARAKSAEIVLQTIHKFVKDEPVFVTGDFNSTPGSRPHAIMTRKNGLRDSYDLSDSMRVGPDFTYVGFKVTSDTKPERIDYVFVNNHVEIKNYAVISDYRGEYHPSDHFPIIADFKLK